MGILQYIIVALLSLVSGYFWIKKRSIVWWEWLGGTAIGILIVIVTHMIIEYGRTVDTETWSGVTISATYQPKWVSEEDEAVYETDSDGNQTLSHYRKVYETHYPKWWVDYDIGENGEVSISEAKYNELLTKFGSSKPTTGYRPDFYSGDRNDYVTINKNNWIEPFTLVKRFENKIKAAPTTFSFMEVTDRSSIHEWPENNDHFKSDRLFGRANAIGILEWDKMNARLGPFKKVNVICIGFPESSSVDVAHLQEAAWIGGKKNDLVICYGGGLREKVGWSYVFGWTDSELVKLNLQTIMMNNNVDKSIINKIESEIIKNYELVNWSQFDYIAIDLPWWAFPLTLILQLSAQFGFFLWAHHNEFSKERRS